MSRDVPTDETAWDLVELGPDDLGLLRNINQLFGEAFSDPERYYASPPGDDHLRRLLASEAFIALVARNGRSIIGAITAYELVKCERETREVYLYDLAVAEGSRRKGIATALIDRLRGIASRRGAELVFVQADRDDPEAVALYSNLAESREVYHFSFRPLPMVLSD